MDYNRLDHGPKTIPGSFSFPLTKHYLYNDLKLKDMENDPGALPPLPFHIWPRSHKKAAQVWTGHLIHVENPRFVCEYSINKPPEKSCRLFLHVKEYNTYLFDFELLDGRRLKDEYSVLFSKMLDAARVLDAMLFLRSPDDRSKK